MEMYWPIILIVLSNVFTGICSKSTPNDVNPFASLTVTYIVGAVVSGILYFALNRNGNLLREYQHVNWTAFVFGLAIVGFQVGSIYMYKLGWDVSTGQLVYSAITAMFLILVGCLLYHEPITLKEIVGVLICMLGLYIIKK